MSFIPSLCVHFFPAGLLGHSNVPHLSTFFLILPKPSRTFSSYFPGMGETEEKRYDTIDQHGGGQGVGKA